MDFKTKNEKKDNREICKYGSECYQKNPFHLAKFRHPKRNTAQPCENAAKKPKHDKDPGPSRPNSVNISQKNNEKTLEDATKEKEVSRSDKLHDVSDSDDEPSIDEKGSKIVEAPTKSDETSENESITDRLHGDIQERLNQLYIVEFPQDFYRFYEFCKSINFKFPKSALKGVNLELVGPFDYLSGDITSASTEDIIRHYRYFYDPPEFYTVLRCTDSEFHYGYFFDEPDKPPVFLVSNDPSKNCKIKIVAPNIFGAVNSYINSFLQTCDPFKKIKIQKLQSSLTKWAKQYKFSVDTTSSAVKQRNSKVTSRTFNEVGIVVPYDKKTDVGYRPLAENNDTLKDLFTKIAQCETETERSVRWDKIEHVITFASIAADECDIGTPLELGLDMFCMGHPCFHRTAQALMTMAYNLLGRNHFSTVIDVHLKNRLKGSDLNFAALKK